MFFSVLNSDKTPDFQRVDDNLNLFKLSLWVKERHDAIGRKSVKMNRYESYLFTFRSGKNVTKGQMIKNVYTLHSEVGVGIGVGVDWSRSP